MTVRYRTNYNRSQGLLYGVATDDLMGHTQTKAHKDWKAMIRRVYSEHTKPSSAEVCTGWLTYSNFLVWHQKQYAPDNWQLDKDLFHTTGGKLYCPKHCCFLPPEINNYISVLLNEATPKILKRNSGTYTVILHKDNNKLSFKGYQTKDNCLKMVKEFKINLLADKLAEYPDIPERTLNRLSELVEEFRKTS